MPRTKVPPDEAARNRELMSQLALSLLTPMSISRGGWWGRVARHLSRATGREWSTSTVSAVANGRRRMPDAWAALLCPPPTAPACPGRETTP